MLRRFFATAHTRISSSIDVLTYRKGRIEALIDLDVNSQQAFEDRVHSLRVELDNAINDARQKYDRAVRAAFVDFGKIALEPPIELTRVVPKQQADEPAPRDAAFFAPKNPIGLGVAS